MNIKDCHDVMLSVQVAERKTISKHLFSFAFDLVGMYKTSKKLQAEWVTRS